MMTLFLIALTIIVRGFVNVLTESVKNKKKLKRGTKWIENFKKKGMS